MDEVLTASLKSRLNSMKSEKKGNSPLIELLALLTMAVGKFLLLSLTIWWGWNALTEVFGVPSIGYWQIVSIAVCLRSIGMLLIDPIFSNLKSKSSK